MRYNPPAGSQDPDAKYVTGQPGKARGSAVPAEAVEHPQREIVEVIKQAGLEPSGDDLTQLRQAIGILVASAAPGLATTESPGLVQIGSGLSITAQGLLSVLTATAAQAGILRPDGTTCQVVDGVLKVLQQSNDYMEAWRKSWIGVPRYWRSTTLPPNHCWANGDFVAFADWPELEQVYNSGGFAGMLLDWDADGPTQAANLGRWRPDAAEPTGLFTPNLVGQFLRGWGPDAPQNAGCWQDHAMQQWYGCFFRPSTSTVYTLGAFGGASGSGGMVGTTTVGNTNTYYVRPYTSITAAVSANMDTETRPVTVWQPLIIYLGQPAAA